MYYATPKNRTELANRVIPSVLTFVISFITFQSSVYANTKEKIAEDYRIKGYAEQQKGNFDNALTYYTKALSLGPDNAVVYNDIGIIYDHLGILQRAEENYLKAIKVDPQYLPPYLNLAYLYRQQGDTQKAIKYFYERVKRAGPDDPWAEKAKLELNNLDPSIKEKMLDEQAQALAKELISKAHDDFYLEISRSAEHFARGQEFIQEKRYTEASEEFDRALSITPNNPKIIKAKEEVVYLESINEIRKKADYAIKILDAGDLSAAKEEFRKILSLIPDMPNQKSE